MEAHLLEEEIIERVLNRLKEKYVWHKINDETEALEALSLQYFLAKQKGDEVERKRLLELIHLLDFSARNVIYQYAEDLSLDMLEEEWKRYLEEENV